MNDPFNLKRVFSASVCSDQTCPLVALWAERVLSWPLFEPRISRHRGLSI